MPADLKQNIFYTIFFIFLHNFTAIFYLAGIIISALLLFIKPSRAKTLFLLGFIILLFAFEYNKHIVEPLRDQTLNSLITIQEHHKVRWLVNSLLVKILPRGLPVIGWLLIITGTVLNAFRLDKKSKR